MSKRSEILSHIGSYSAASFLTQILGLLAAIISRRFLGPAQMGMWAVLQVLVDYAAYSSLGASEAAPREIPFFQGKGDVDRATRIKNVVFSFSLVSALVIAAALWGYALLFRSALSYETFYGLLFAGIVIILQRINNLLVVLLRAYKFFFLASKQMIWSAILNALLVAFFSYHFALFGFMIALCISYLFNIVYILWNSKLNIRWAWNWMDIKGLIVYGFPLQILGIFNTVFSSLDKLFIASLMGLKFVGLYGVAVMGMQYLANLPNSVSTVLVSHFHEQYGKRENVNDLKEYLAKASFGFCEMMTVLVVLGWIYTPYFIRLLLPEFSESVRSAQLLLLGSFFLAMVYPYTTCIIVIKKHTALLPVMIAACFIAMIAYPYVIRRGWGIEGLAWAGLVILYLRFTAVYLLTILYLHDTLFAIRGYLKILGRFFLIAVFLAVLDFGTLQSIHSYTRPLAHSALFFVLYTPFLLKFHREYGLFNFFKWKTRESDV